MTDSNSDPSDAPTEKSEIRRMRQQQDQDRLRKTGKGSGLDVLEEEQRDSASKKKNNKLRSDEVKHH